MRRRDVHGLQSPFNEKRPRPAEGVVQYAVPPDPGHVQNSRRQSLLDGSLGGVPPVPPLVEPRPGGVQENADPVLENLELDLMDRPGLLEPPHPVLLPEPLHGGLLDNGLAVRDAVELGLVGVPLHRKGVLPADEVLERQFPGPVEQLGEAPGLKLPQENEDPLRRAETEVGPGQHGKIPGKADAAVGGGDVLRVQPAELPGQDAFQAEMTRCGKSQIIHKRYPYIKNGSGFPLPLIVPQIPAFAKPISAERSGHSRLRSGGRPR